MSSRHTSRSTTQKRKQKPRKSSPRTSSQQQYGRFRSPATVVPNEIVVRLKYVDQFTLNATTASTDNYLFRANSLYDPNYTGAGHQPFGYDQWTLFYSNWVVERATAQFVTTPPNLSTATPQIDNCILYLTKRRSDPSVYTDINTAIEDPFCVSHRMITGYQRPPVLRCTIDNPSFLGVDRKVYLSSSEYSGGIGANPTVQTYFICGAGTTLSGTNNPDPVYVTMTINYTVKFYNVIATTGSSVSKPTVAKPHDSSHDPKDHHRKPLQLMSSKTEALD